MPVAKTTPEEANKLVQEEINKLTKERTRELLRIKNLDDEIQESLEKHLHSLTNSIARLKESTVETKALLKNYELINMTAKGALLYKEQNIHHLETQKKLLEAQLKDEDELQKYMDKHEVSKKQALKDGIKALAQLDGRIEREKTLLNIADRHTASLADSKKAYEEISKEVVSFATVYEGAFDISKASK
jgi:predicted glutamine amidotransferase